MLQPKELQLDLPMEVGKGTVSTTKMVWEILLASYRGDLLKVKELVNGEPDLVYAQYNYAPPVQFAVREGHADLVKFFLDKGAHDPDYKFYPFQESLQTVAGDRGYAEIAELLNEYATDKTRQQYKGDNGRIWYNRTALQEEFERAVGENNLTRTEEILKEQPEFALDETYCWSEGILLFPAKSNNREIIDLLMGYGARVPMVLKWTQFYYFERLDGATYMMEKGMNPNTMSWQHVTILHDMAQKGLKNKAELLIKYGAWLDPVDEVYQSTPLGLAARWGNIEMVEYLIRKGADVNKAGAAWSTPVAWARKKGHREIERLLIRSGANQ